MIVGYREINAALGSRRGVVSGEAFFRQISALRASIVVPLDAYDHDNPRHAAIVLFGLGGRALALAASLLTELDFPFGLCLTVEEAEAVVGNGLGAPDLATACGCPPGSALEIITVDSAGNDCTGLSEAFLQRFGARLSRWKVLNDPQGKRDLAVRREPSADATAALHPIRMMRESDSLFKGSVAAIITNFNYGPMLREAVDSVDRQLVQPDEFLVVDDASTDGSFLVLDELEAAGKTVIRHPANLGIVDNFRFCVERTTSDYLFFLGADNRIRSDFVLECRLALDSHPAVDVAYTDTLLFGVLAGELARKVGADRIGHAPASNWDIYHWRFPDPTPEVLATFQTRNFVHGSSMYRRSAYERVGGYRKSDQPEDHNIFHRIWSSGGGLAHVAKPLLEYRQHSIAQANNLSALQIENRGLRAQLQAAKDRFGEVEDGYHRQQHEVARVNAAFTALDLEYERVAAAFSEQVARIAECGDALTAQAAEIARLNTSLGHQNIEIARLNIAYGEQLSALNARDDEIAGRDAEIARVNIAFGDQNAELIRLNLAYEEQLLALNAREREIAARDVEIARVNIAFDDQNAELIRLNFAYEEQLLALDARDREIEARDAEIAHLNAAFEQKDTEVRTINNAYGNQSSELACLHSKLNATIAEAHELKLTLRCRDAELAAAHNARDLAKREVECLERGRAELTSAILMRENGLKAVRLQASALRRQVRAILDDLDTWPQRRSGYLLFPVARRAQRLRETLNVVLKDEILQYDDL